MSINQALQKIEQAGFTLAIDGPDLVVNPPGKLSPAQRQFIVDHKPEIIAVLRDAANDYQAGPHVSIEQLPARLVNAATRVCKEVHGDTPEQAHEMLVDLTWNDPRDWQALIHHFESQIPKNRPP